MELQAKKKVTAPATSSTNANGASRSGAAGIIPSTPAPMSALFGGAGGAAAAAGVLTAVDEDEDNEEAPVPDDFDLPPQEDDGDQMEE